MDGFFGELKRRNVVRVSIAYIVVGWIVVQIGEIMFEAFGTPAWVLKTVIGLIAIGFPFAALFAWAFELTPEGVKKTRDVKVAASVTASTGRKLDFVIIAALVVALGYFIWERETLDSIDQTIVEQTSGQQVEAVDEVAGSSESADPSRSIAVLPFVSMSSDKEQEWFADGLTEEILNSLARTPDLLVSARTSSFAFKESSEDIPTIASALGVDHVLEGSVRSGGDRLRITAQLIRAADGFHLWSQTYDRTPDDVIAIQEEIAIQIAKALETAMDPEALADMMSVGTRSVPAYAAYLIGMGAWGEAAASGDVYMLLDARDAFIEAVGLDSEFSTAYIRLHVFWALQLASNQVMYGITDLSYEERVAKRDAALDNAIRFEKDETTQLHYRASKAWDQLEFRRALRLISEFLEQRPNAQFADGMQMNLRKFLGLHEEIAQAIQETFENKELTRSFANQALQALRTVEHKDLMHSVAYAAIDKFHDDVFILYQAHRQLLWAGDIDGASKVLPDILKSDMPEDNRFLAELRQICSEQRSESAAKLHARAIAKNPDDLSMNWLAYKIVGDDDAAERLFQEVDAREDHDTLATFLAYSHFDPAPLTNFMQAMAGQGIEERRVQDLPYRCNR